MSTIEELICIERSNRLDFLEFLLSIRLERLKNQGPTSMIPSLHEKKCLLLSVANYHRYKIEKLESLQELLSYDVGQKWPDWS